MKKLVSLLLVLAMVFAFAACGAKTEAPAQEAPAEEAAETPVEEVVAEENAIVVDTCILMEADNKMLNTYSVLAVNPDAPFEDADKNPVSDVEINVEGATALYQWLVSQEALDLAGAYGVEEYGANLFYVKEDAPVYTGEIAPATEETKLIRLSTTTSVNDSGLLAKLLPEFKAKYGYEVDVYSAGTGKSIANAKMGNADIILVHSKSQEEAFVEGGFARVVEGFEAERTSFIYNFYVLCGPSADPAGAASAASVMDAFALIAEGKHTFVSRGDNSGTHTKEISLWPEALAITVEADSFAAYTDWYVSANAGMGVCLVMAEEMGAYILTDKATFLTFVKNDGIMG